MFKNYTLYMIFTPIMLLVLRKWKNHYFTFYDVFLFNSLLSCILFQEGRIYIQLLHKMSQNILKIHNIFTSNFIDAIITKSCTVI